MTGYGWKCRKTVRRVNVVALVGECMAWMLFHCKESVYYEVWMLLHFEENGIGVDVVAL